MSVVMINIFDQSKGPILTPDTSRGKRGRQTKMGLKNLKEKMNKNCQYDIFCQNK